MDRVNECHQCLNWRAEADWQTQKYKLRKMLKPFIGWICLFMALHSTNHILTSTGNCYLNVSCQADVAHRTTCKVIYCLQTLMECSPTALLPPSCLSPPLCPGPTKPYSSQKVSRHSIPPFLAHAVVSLPGCCFPDSIFLSFNLSECSIPCEGQLAPLTAAICSV